MPKHMPERLNKLQIPAPLNPQHSPGKHDVPTCGAKTQYADNNDYEQTLLPVNKMKFIQKAVGIISYYATALDNTSLIALNNLDASQSTAKESKKYDIV